MMRLLAKLSTFFYGWLGRCKEGQNKIMESVSEQLPCANPILLHVVKVAGLWSPVSVDLALVFLYLCFVCLCVFGKRWKGGYQAGLWSPVSAAAGEG